MHQWNEATKSSAEKNSTRKQRRRKGEKTFVTYDSSQVRDFF